MPQSYKSISGCGLKEICLLIFFIFIFSWNKVCFWFTRLLWFFCTASCGPNILVTHTGKHKLGSGGAPQSLVSGKLYYYYFFFLPIDGFLVLSCIWCLDNLGIQEDLVDMLLIAEPEGNGGCSNSSSGHWVICLRPFGTDKGSCDPTCSNVLSVLFNCHIMLKLSTVRLMW